MFHQLAAREFFVLDDLKLLRFALVLISNGQLEGKSNFSITAFTLFCWIL